MLCGASKPAWNHAISRSTCAPSRAASSLQHGACHTDNAPAARHASCATHLPLPVRPSARRPIDALSWALLCSEGMKRLPWPTKLLTHEQFETITAPEHQPDGNVKDKVVMRGMRLKVGGDWGQGQCPPCAQDALLGAGLVGGLVGAGLGV